MSISDSLFQPFLDSVYVSSHSWKTISAYRSGLKHLEKFALQKYQCDLNTLLSRIKQKELDIYKVLNEFVIHLDKLGMKASSIKTWTAAVKGFFRHHEIKVYAEDFKQSVRIPKLVRHREEPITKEIIIRLLHNATPRLRTVILIAVASGMRIGEIAQLRTSDIDFSSKPVKIRIRAETTKGKTQARESFLTSEAASGLKDYLKRTFDWNETSPDRSIFEKIEKNTDQSTKGIIESLTGSLRRACKNIPELTRLNEGGRRMIHFHAFRKYFRTKVGNATNRDFAEALMGHRFYLDTYYNLSEQEKQKMYLKAEPELTISDYTEIEKRLTMTAEKQREYEYNQATFAKALQHSLGLPSGLLEMLMNETK